ncbi:cytoplasmic dynein intermediate chain [Tieghemostelium lacteum]|uniref:Cytoplasmic dynein intermediate chain n=1 Tax=Tieghemostelium lacteum TaxID=361077 RepID=A0A151Z6W6_TIELA|nr:cytoplasmic dynein intermediate chain [Tieghemostelium lacteum]|eukprot:KYQ89703.1 cytoplasmic dynein intermediate chain [Tieghemostelium lacteum]
MAEQRKKELEEMKKKLAGLKEARAQASNKQTKPTSPTLDSANNNNNNNISPPTVGAKKEDFSSLLDSVNQLTSPLMAPPVTATPDGSSQTQQQQQNSPPLKLEDILSKLSISSLVIEIDIPPKETPMYSKSTQTETADGQNEEEQDLKAPVKAKLKYQQQQPQYNTDSTQTSAVDSSLETSSANEDANNQQQSQQQQQQQQSQKPEIPELSEYEKQQVWDSDHFKSFFTRSAKVIERALYLDDEIDILADYTQSNQSNKSSDKELRLISTLQDERWTKHRSVTDINWSPKHPELVVTSYSANEAGSHDPDGVVLVWSINNIYQKPEYIFNCQSPVMTTFFSKFHPTLIVGGTYSGQIVVWDTRAKSTPVQRTPLSSIGHTHPVYSMSVIGSTNANSLVAISTDGKLCSWNLENLSQPTETIELNSKNLQNSGSGSGGGVGQGGAQPGVTSPTTNQSSQSGLALAVTSLVFPENELSTFYVGTEEGVICQGARHGSKVGINERFRGHFGPITSVDLHPAQKGNIDFTNYFVTSSTDWTCKLWSTKKPDAPLYSFEDYVDYVYDARWSPVHPSIFSTGDGSGLLSLWNLNEDTEAPIFRHKVSQRSLNRLSWSNDGKRLLAGDSGGALYLYDSSEFSNPDISEWNQFEGVINKLISKKDSQDSPLLGGGGNQDQNSLIE